MLIEYGVDVNLVYQIEYFGDVLNWGKFFYLEIFQIKIYEYQWSIIKDYLYIIVFYFWNMFDFVVFMWICGGVFVCNMKGLIIFDCKIKKDFYFWYKVNWSEELVFYFIQCCNVDCEK